MPTAVRIGSSVSLSSNLSNWDDVLTNGQWEDLRFPAQALNPPGAVSDPDIDPNTGLILFDKGSTERIVGVAQMPHARMADTAISPHIHVRATEATPPAGGARSCVMLWEYKWYNHNAQTPAAYTSEQTTFDLLDDVGGLATNTIWSFTDITGTGLIGSSMLEWRISRIGGDAADTYDNDLVLVEFDIHYMVNRFGSTNEAPTD